MRSRVEMIAIAAYTVLLVPMFAPAAAAERPALKAVEETAVAALADPTPTVTAPLVSSSLFESSGTAPAVIQYNAPRVELFLGYSYLRAMPSIDAANRLFWLNGGSTSLAFNFNRYVGLVGDFGGFADSELNLTGTDSSHPVDSSGKVFTYLFGPRFSYRKHNRVTPFAQVLAGAIHASEVTLSNCTDVCQLLPSETSFALTAGVGVDVRVHRHLAIRVVQAEYLMTRFEDRTTGQTAMQNDIRLSSGIVFRFGGQEGHPPASPLNYSCSVSPSGLFAGEPVAVVGSPGNLNSAKTAVYTWVADGGVVSGNSTTANIDTKGLNAGTYTVKGHVSEGSKPDENADCSASFTVKAFEPPTISCSANPTTLSPGESSTITATAVSPQGRPLTYSYTATAGVVSGNGANATLSTTGSPAGSITVTCNAADDRGLTASASTPVTVIAPYTAPKPSPSALCSLDFARDPHRPARVNNEAKACLDDIALTLQRTSDSKLAIVGNTASGEKKGQQLAKERALNAKQYLVHEKGVDSSRIILYTGSQDGMKVTTVLIPDGATFDANGDIVVEEKK